MVETVKVAVAGVNGRMGRAATRAILKEGDLQLAGAFGKPGASYAGKDVGDVIQAQPTGILVSNGIEEILAGGRLPDVLLDFTEAEAAFTSAKTALDKGVRPVIGTSGISLERQQVLIEMAQQKGIGGLIVPNFSLGAVLMIDFARRAGEHFEHVEIVEMHHAGKVDAPSGTAMYTARKLAGVGANFNPKNVQEHEVIAGARGAQLDSGVRIHSLRLPGLISHQEVIFGSAGELLTIQHDSFNTDCFLKGILLAIRSVIYRVGMSVGLETLFAGG